MANSTSAKRRQRILLSLSLTQKGGLYWKTVDSNRLKMYDYSPETQALVAQSDRASVS